MNVRLIVPVLATLGAAACSTGRYATRPSGLPGAGEQEAAVVAAADPESASHAVAYDVDLSQQAPSAGRAQDASAPERPPDTQPGPRAPMLVYRANLTMSIFETAPALKAVEALAGELGGFLTRQTNDAITIRVPVARFKEALGRLEKLGDVTARSIEAEDVTQEFFDLEVRLKSARAVRERLEQLLARATKVEESIAIERELERVVGEIERLQGRIKFLADQARYSTISVLFAARPKEVVAKGTFKLPFPWLEELGLGRLLDLGAR